MNIHIVQTDIYLVVEPLVAMRNEFHLNSIAGISGQIYYLLFPSIVRRRLLCTVDCAQCGPRTASSSYLHHQLINEGTVHVVPEGHFWSRQWAYIHQW